MELAWLSEKGRIIQDNSGGSQMKDLGRPTVSNTVEIEEVEAQEEATAE